MELWSFFYSMILSIKENKKQRTKQIFFILKKKKQWNDHNCNLENSNRKEIMKEVFGES